MEKIALLVMMVILTQGSVKAITYKAAVVEFSPDMTTNDSVMRAQNNLDGFESALQSIQNDGVQIIVFPEDAISGVVNIIFEQLPELDANPCMDNGFESRPILKRLSCLARDYEVVLVANMGGMQGDAPYNTDVVFETDGRLIAKYYKINLFDHEKNIYSPGNQTDGVSFETFNVTFGIFTCYDILFQQPSQPLVKSGIKNFVFPTAWGNKFPIYMSTALQQGWSLQNNVNFLAANLHVNIQKFYGTGSGIYSAGTAKRYFMTGNNITNATVLVAELTSEPADITDKTQIPIIENTNSIQTTNQNKFVTFEYLTTTNGTLIATREQNGQELQCRLEYKIRPGNGSNVVQETYALGAFIRLHNIQAACFVVKCSNMNTCGQLIVSGAETKFEYLRLEGSFPQSTLFPTTFSDGFTLLPTSAFNLNMNGVEVVNSSIIAHTLNFITVTGSACMHTNMPILVVSLLVLALCCMI